MIALAIEDSAALPGDGGRRVSAHASLYVMDAARDDALPAAYALRASRKPTTKRRDDADLGAARCKRCFRSRPTRC